jgi:pyruvate/2-oxoglutarate dehydrogenase complex dihydrolipoamide acyltransferase (E2) component
MSIEVTMPQMGESVVEGTISKWLVKEGDIVTEDQPLCEISTDKVDTEIPSPGAGRIAKIVAQEGQTVPVGAALAIIEGQGAPVSEAKTPPAPKPAAKPALPPAPAPIREIRPAAAPAPRADSPAAAAAVQQVAALAAGDGDTAPRRYSPVVMKMAAEHRIDLALIPGTGIGGRVSKRDVTRYLDSLRASGAKSSAGNGAAAQSASPAAMPALAPAPAAPASGGAFHPPVYQPREGDIVEPFTRRRKLIAEHMVFSKTHSPHVPTVAEVDMTRISRLRDKHKAAFAAREGFALTMLPLIAAATVRALKEFPRMNASVVGDAVVIRREINLGIAMDSDEGLLVPVLKRAEGMSVVGIAREIAALQRKVADKKITPDDLSGGSFTLSNPGREGNLYGFAIINQPQVGILRMGEVKKRPVVIEIDGEDAIAIRTMMYLALSYDHRVIDGVLGNRFLYRAARIIEEADFEL